MTASERIFMNRLKDNIWLWGQTPGSHHSSNVYNLPGENKMTPVEGCEYFGIKNCCRVAMTLGPVPPFDEESKQMAHLDKVIWSLVGAGGVTRNEKDFADLEYVIPQAKQFSNVVGGVMDDFLLNDHRRANYTPEKLRRMRRLFTEGAGREMELWTVYYDRELHIPVQEYLDVFDVITFWTWYGENILKLEENLERVIASTPGKRRLAGCYMWDYGNGKPLTPELMEMQLEIYRKFMHEGKLEGIILCSNCIADIGIPEVEQTRQWIREHGDEILENKVESL